MWKREDTFSAQNGSARLISKHLIVKQLLICNNNNFTSFLRQNNHEQF